MRLRLVALLLLPACAPARGNSYDGYFMHQFFPFDGQRTWIFQNDDATVPYLVIATLDPEPPAIGECAVEVHTIDSAIGCFVRRECRRRPTYQEHSL